MAAKTDQANNTREELERLRIECDRLREERDAAEADLKARLDTADEGISDKLRVLSATLSREIQEQFMGWVKTLLWVVAILVGAATLGGFYQFRQTIDSTVTQKVDAAVTLRVAARDKDIDKLRDRVTETIGHNEAQAVLMQAQLNEMLGSFRASVQTAAVEIAAKKESLLIVIENTRRFAAESIYPATGSQGGTPPTVAAWPTNQLNNLLVITGSAPDEFASDSSINEVPQGLFSALFQKSLGDPKTDLDGDGVVSFREAVTAASALIAGQRLTQHPAINGSDPAFGLFSTKAVPDANKPSRSVFALLVGINKYQTTNNGKLNELRGAVNDAWGFKRLLDDRGRVMASRIEAKILTDEQATREAIFDELKAVADKANENDVVIFYFSGQIDKVPAESDGNTAVLVKALIPHNFMQDGKSNALTATQVLTAMKQIKARQRILIIDG